MVLSEPLNTSIISTLAIMGYPKFFPSIQTRGSQQQALRLPFLEQRYTKYLHRMWNTQMGVEEMTLPRSTPLWLKSTIQGITTSNLSQNRQHLTFHLARTFVGLFFFFLLQLKECILIYIYMIFPIYCEIFDTHQFHRNQKTS